LQRITAVAEWARGAARHIGGTAEAAIGDKVAGRHRVVSAKPALSPVSSTVPLPFLKKPPVPENVPPKVVSPSGQG